MKKFLLLIFCLVPTLSWILGGFAIGTLAVEMVDINTATLAQLDTLTGIGPVYAQRIIDGRPYSSIDDLDRVKGIGPATIQKIKDQGLACVNCSNYSNSPNYSNQTPSPNDQITKPAESGTPPTSPTSAITYPSGVFINKILPNPEGPDETDEWIELYNSNNFDIDLSGWKLQDRAGTITTYTIPSVTKIMTSGYMIFKRPDTKIMLNNDGDGVNLLTPDSKIVDSVGFISAPLGQSYNKSGNNWMWSGPSSDSLTKTQKPAKNSIVETKDLTAALTNPEGLLWANSGTNNPWFLFFTVLGATIILALLVLFIKFKLNKNVRS